jgi:hypothetical protein
MHRILKSFGCATLLLLFVSAMLKAEPNSALPISGAAGVSTDLYWITFSGDCSCDHIFLMQIDADGNTVIAPKPVLSLADVSGNTSALSKNGTQKLNLFHWNKKAKLTRTVIDKATLKVIGKKTTTITTKDGEFLQATQRDQDNFVIGERVTGPLAAYKLSATAVPKAPGSDLDSNIPMTNDEASISSDGLMLITNRSDLDINTPDKLYAQVLDAQGVPQGTPKLLASFQDIEASDVTDVLESGLRFVVYVVDSGTIPDDRLYLQKINSSGAKVGGKKLINTPPNREEDAQTVAIDPLGRFVVFTIQGDDFGCFGQDILVYQKLSSTGEKSGPLKVLANCSLVVDDMKNLDILKE